MLCHFPYSSSIFLVLKPNKKYYLLQIFKKTIVPIYPIVPNPYDILDQCSWYSVNKLKNILHCSLDQKYPLLFIFI